MCNDCSRHQYSILQQNLPIRTHTLIEQAQVCRCDETRLTRMVTLILFIIVNFPNSPGHTSESLSVHIILIQCKAFSGNIALRVAPLVTCVKTVNTSLNIPFRLETDDGLPSSQCPSNIVYNKRVGICRPHNASPPCPCFLHGDSDRHSIRSHRQCQSCHVPSSRRLA